MSFFCTVMLVYTIFKVGLHNWHGTIHKYALLLHKLVIVARKDIRCDAPTLTEKYLFVFKADLTVAEIQAFI